MSLPRRFVVLRHEGHGATHFDLLIEAGAALAAWQFAAAPTLLPAGGTLAGRRLADHRTAYLDYEGPVSGGRGRVEREAGGDCEVLCATDECWRLEFRGPTLHGSYTLTRHTTAWALTRGT